MHIEPIDSVGTSALPVAAVNATQKVMIVNGSADVLELLETVLEAGHYDVIFVESNEHAYSHIRRVRPDLVILCVAIDDAEGLRVLSMLKLDEHTRRIPILTYATEGPPGSTNDTEDDATDEADEQLFGLKQVLRMN
jgi:PleD family two-component response regulator